MPRLVFLVLLASSFLWPASTASAATIIVPVGFSGTPLNVVDLTPFDSSLGTLDGVSVSINGVASVTGQAPQQGIVTNTGFQPIPYDFFVDLSQDFDGLGSELFEFSTPATMVFHGTSSGLLQPFAFVQPFSYSFAFDAITDLVGFDVPTVTGGFIPPAGGVLGTRSGFLDTTALVHQLLITHFATPSAIGGPVPLISSVDVSGFMQIEYSYTPAVAAVPEPATLTLLGGGLLAGVVRRRRRR